MSPVRTLQVSFPGFELPSVEHRATRWNVEGGALHIWNDPRPSMLSGTHVISYSLASVLCWEWKEDS